MKTEQMVLTGKELENYESYQKNRQEVIRATIDFAFNRIFILGMIFGTLLGIVFMFIMIAMGGF